MNLASGTSTPRPRSPSSPPARRSPRRGTRPSPPRGGPRSTRPWITSIRLPGSSVAQLRRRLVDVAGLAPRPRSAGTPRSPATCPGGHVPPVGKRARATGPAISVVLGRAAARRRLAQRRQVELADQRQRQRARDRRRGQHQQVRRPALVAQRRPLTHPEAVLLVDHHQAEAAKLHVLGQQRMSRRPGRPCPRPPPRSPLARSPRVIEPVSSARRIPPPGTTRAASQVLLRQDLGRRHPRRLPARGHDPALAANATSVLPEPTSPCSSRSIGRGCARSASISSMRPLRLRRLERHARAQLLAARAFVRQQRHGHRQRLRGRPAAQQRQLGHQQLLEQHASVRRRAPGLQRRDRPRPAAPRRARAAAPAPTRRHQAQACAQLGRQGIDQRGLAAAPAPPGTAWPASPRRRPRPPDSGPRSPARAPRGRGSRGGSAPACPSCG